MMNNDMLQNIECLREKANISYEDAAQLLEQFGGNVMGAIVELEKQGRLYSQGSSGNAQPNNADPCQKDACEAKKKASSFFQKASKTRVLIEKKRENGVTETVVNVSALIAACVTIFAPYITLAAAAIGVASGYNVKVERPEEKA